MPLFHRDEGDPVRDAGLLRRMLPFLMRGRNESAIYFEQELDVTAALACLQSLNQGLASKRASFFQLLLCALLRTLAARPGLQRFIVGQRLYQRRHLDLSFAVKKRLTDDAAMTTVKVRFAPADTLDDVARRIDAAIGEGRGAQATTSEQEMRIVTALPGCVIRFVMAAQRWLDGLNLLPAAMIRNDPLYASAFIANLGSVGLDAPFHHLYEYGTIPLFVVIGRIRPQADGRSLVTLRITYDERINDGFYCARSLELFRGLVAHPEQLLQPPAVGVSI